MGWETSQQIRQSLLAVSFPHFIESHRSPPITAATGCLNVRGRPFRRSHLCQPPTSGPAKNYAERQCAPTDVDLWSRSVMLLAYSTAAQRGLLGAATQRS